MKNILGFLWIAFLLLAGLFVATRGRSTPFSAATVRDTIPATILTASGTTTTNKVGSSLYVEGVLYHTFHGINGGSTLQQFAVDRSLDNTNWVVVSTNALLASGTTEVTMTGKFSFVRARQIGTNAAMNVLYLGGN